MNEAFRDQESIDFEAGFSLDVVRGDESDVNLFSNIFI